MLAIGLKVFVFRAPNTLQSPIGTTVITLIFPSAAFFQDSIFPSLFKALHRNRRYLAWELSLRSTNISGCLEVFLGALLIKSYDDPASLNYENNNKLNKCRPP